MVASVMKAEIRMAQGKPMRLMRRSRAMGKMIPPTAAPEVTQPMARPRCLTNQVDGAPMLGTKRQPRPIPTQMPWERRACQYVVMREVIIWPNMMRKPPVRMRLRR